MKPNVGTADRTLRIILGLAIIGYGVLNQSWLGSLCAVPLLTCFIRCCPALPGLLSARRQNDGHGLQGCRRRVLRRRQMQLVNAARE